MLFLKCMIISKEPAKKIKIRDVHMISKAKHFFEKGYTSSWATELLTIAKVHNQSSNIPLGRYERSTNWRWILLATVSESYK